MQMSFLVDQLETLFENARRLPFGRVLLDEHELGEIIGQMRYAEPHELNQARRIIQEHEQIISRAQAESNELIAMARDRVAQILSKDGLLIAAKEHAEMLLGDARAEAEGLRANAERYVYDLLSELERSLASQERVIAERLAEIRNGLEQLQPPQG